MTLSDLTFLFVTFIVYTLLVNSSTSLREDCYVKRSLNSFEFGEDSNEYLVTKIPKYVRVMERLIEHFSQNKYKIDAEALSGLFLVNVNFKHVLETETAPEITVYYKLKTMLNQTSNFIRLYRTKKSAGRALPSVYLMDDFWRRKMTEFDKFKFKKVIHSSPKKNLFKNWKAYEKKAKPRVGWIPSREEFQACMSVLTNNNLISNKRYKCDFDDCCKNMIQIGTDYSFPLLHRILFILLAHYGRGCYIVSPAKDAEMVRSMCTNVYYEAQYIAKNAYKMPELMMQQILVCSLDGQVLLINTTWLDELAKYQINSGCFSSNPPNQKRRACHKKLTVLALGTYSIAIRKILLDEI